MSRWRPSAPVLRLILLTVFAVAVHGYHLGVDDAAIYLPAVKKIIDPRLYPFGTEFFLSHARLSQFAVVVGGSARLTHLSGDLVIFLWHIATVFAFLYAIWRLASVCFDSARARWSGVLLLASVLTVPATGTALVLMDPYLTARSASTPMTILAVALYLSGKRLQAVFWLALTALVHPQMAVYGIVCLGLLSLPQRWAEAIFRPRKPQQTSVLAGALPTGFSLKPVAPEYREALYMRTFFFMQQWTWYEWVGILAPLGLLIWFSRIAPRGATAAFARISRALTAFGIAATLLGLLFSSSPNFESFVRIQPMRAFHLIYIVFFLLLGGLLGEYLLKSRYWLWISLYTAIGGGMFLVQRATFEHSRHVEWPWAAPRNEWVQAFLWIRHNTPQNAIFALDPRYIVLPEEDQHGFRPIAERSMLSDHYKDSGVVSLFPQLAPEWHREQQAQQGWESFQLSDFQQLARQYPVSWVVLSGKAPAGLDCRYRNPAVTVCKIPGATGLN